MMYPYGPKLSPRVGNGLGGLPKRDDMLKLGLPITLPPALVLVVASTNTVRPPKWASYMRVSAVGSGGNGTVSNAGAGGGGGGGYAGTNIVRASPSAIVDVSISVAGVTSVNFQGYALTGGRGANGASGNGGAGGVGSGGDLNFTGGNGGNHTGTAGFAGGGGAAGRGGNGVSAPNASGTGNSIGGNGGLGADMLSGGSGGGSAATPGAIGASPLTPIGGALYFIGEAGKSTGAFNAGGFGGGGGGAQPTGTANPTNGGAGFAVIEFW